MAKVKIVADSTCDLSAKLLQSYGVEVIPLGVNLGDKACLDGVDVHTKDLFDYYNETGKLPTTSAPTPPYYQDFYQKWTDEGYEVVHFSISGEMTSTPNVARMAAVDFPNVYPVDSRNVSAGMGLLAVRACELRDEGLSAEEIRDRILPMREKVRTSFVISTLLYLYKGGRCTGLQAMGANLLNLKPCIEVQNGKMDVTKKYRGSIENVIEKMIADKLTDPKEELDLSRIFIIKYDLPQKTIKEAAEQIKALQPFGAVETMDTGCSVSVHCGPGTLGIIYLTK